jgi:hypothetical protein
MMKGKETPIIVELFLEKQIASSRFWQKEWLVISMIAAVLIILVNLVVSSFLTATSFVSIAIIFMSAIRLGSNEERFRKYIYDQRYKHHEYDDNTPTI